jgi:protein-tyrosine phosphatase
MNQALTVDHAARRLQWDACLNARDLGGYRTRDGSLTRWRSVLRADNLCRLTEVGQAALEAYGVRTVVDLRTASELRIDPHPYAELAGTVAYLHRSLLDEADKPAMKAIDRAESMDSMYAIILDCSRANIAKVMQAIAEAPDGGVLFHCHAGKDRTGLVAAMLLALADVPDATIVEDYALSQTYLQPVYDAALAAVSAPAEREQLAWQMGTRPETMQATLAHLDKEYGGVEAYLRGSGVSDARIEQLRARLRTEA